MDKLRITKVIFSYLKEKKKEIITFIFLITMFLGVFSLYGLPMEPFIYPVFLAFIIGSAFTAVDFYRYLNKHKALCRLLDTVTLSVLELPEPGSLIERDYKDLIELVHQDKVRHIFDADNQRSEMMEYYTIWVHQIKTPIAAMHLLLQSSKNELNTEISVELFKIEQYVEMVLGYLRLDDMSSDFVFKYYDLNEIIKQALRKYAKLFILKKNSLDFEEIDCFVLTDEKWLLFVIEQILSNSLKYTSGGKILIYMQEGEGKNLIIEDTGIGIQKEDLPRIFEKGFTGYNGRSNKKSTGIGLYLCKRILTKLSHEITIESEAGRGTRVKIRLDSMDLKGE